MTIGDDTITFFPTYGYRAGDSDAWRVRIHGWTYRRGERRRIARLLLGALHRGLKLTPDEAESIILRARLSPFLANRGGGGGGRLRIRIGGEVRELPEPNVDGHVRTVVTLPDESLRNGDGGPPPHPRTGTGLATSANLRRVPFRVETGSIGAGVRGEAFLLEPEGLSIVSDLDDTLKHTNVLVRRELLANTFLRPFRAIPGMAEAFAQWSANGAAFHYVSASPWQLATAIDEFLDDAGFPPGTFHLRTFRIRKGGLMQFLKKSEAAKLDAVTRIVEDFPRRRFVLVGDSGERDPEIYGEVARRFPDRVERILIRNATGEPSLGERFRDAFRDVAFDLWGLFRDPSSID